MLERRMMLPESVNQPGLLMESHAQVSGLTVCADLVLSLNWR